MARWAVEKVCDLSDRAWTSKDQWRELLTDCYDYALPDRNPYTFNGTGLPQGKAATVGKDKTSRKVFDSTLITDTVRLVNRIQTELFPIGNQWAALVPGAFVSSENSHRARIELHVLQEVLFAAIGLSNFDLSIAEWLLELVVAGTACMLVQRGDDADPIVFQTVSQSFVALREGAFGRIDLISRKHKMRVSLIKAHWDDAKIDALALTDEQRSEDHEVDVVDVCYFDREANLWYYDVLVMNHVKTGNKARVVERQFKVCPWVIARWAKAADEVQGRSIVSQALPDARVLSAVKSYVLKQAALAIGGVFLVRNDGVVNANNVRIFPGATIPVRSTGGGSAGASVAPLQVGGDIQLATLVIDDLVNSIHKIMLNTGIPDIKDGIRTATEFLERMKDLQQSLGAPFSRVLKEGIVPMLEAAIMVLGDMGVVQLPASGKIKLNNGEVAVKFASPLVQGQALREVDAAVQAMTLTKQLAGDEAAMLSFKVEDLGGWIGGKLGMVPELMRDPTERATLQDMAGRLAAMQAGGMPAVGPNAGVTPNAVRNTPQQPALALAA